MNYTFGLTTYGALDLATAGPCSSRRGRAVRCTVARFAQFDVAAVPIERMRRCTLRSARRCGASSRGSSLTRGQADSAAAAQAGAGEVRMAELIILRVPGSGKTTWARNTWLTTRTQFRSTGTTSAMFHGERCVVDGRRGDDASPPGTRRDRGRA